MGGDTQPDTSIEVVYTPATVYNFTVDGNHNYYVSEDGFLVHNCGGGIVNRGGRFGDLDDIKGAGEVGHHMPQNRFN
jgi:hypothetical protein